MKTKKLLFYIITGITILALFLTACPLTVRPLPTGKVITIFNSRLEKTNKMDMLDTLYVMVGGVQTNAIHDIEVLDPSNNLICKTSLISDEYGVISASPLWYDVGLLKAGKKPDISGELSLKAFSIHVTGPGGTDYTEPFWIVFSKTNLDEQPNPVVWACLADGTLENAFDESGTVNGKTKVYVAAETIPSRIGTTPVSAVDIYVIRSSGPGIILQDKANLADISVVSKTGVTLGIDGTMAPTLVWDLDDESTMLINPSEGNCAYNVVLDVNRNGIFDAGEDVNNDDVIDRHIDGIDGQGVVGFIIQNTETNNFDYKITDGFGNKVNSVEDRDAALYISLKNIPDLLNPVIYLLDAGQATSAVPALTPSPVNNGIDLLRVVDNEVLINTSSGDLRCPDDVTITTVTSYDLFIDLDDNGTFTTGDIFVSNAVMIIHLPVVQELIVSNGTIDTTAFDESGTGSGNSQVYLHTSGLSIPGSTIPVYVMPTPVSWSDGAILNSGYIVNPILNVSSGNIASQLLWDLDGTVKLINPDLTNCNYDIVIDANSNGVYDSGVDYLSSIGFTVRNTPANDVPDVYYANIASGGMYSWNYSTWEYSYDYRDNFMASGSDTLSSHYVSKGIKAIWNPYIKYWYGSESDPDTPSLYYGQWVDVYVVDAATARLQKDGVLGSGTLADVAGGKKSLPVQYSCSNGLGQQNIWIPPFTVGDYFVIVDVDLDGKITEKVDIIDAVNQNLLSIKDDNTVVGFSVY